MRIRFMNPRAQSKDPYTLISAAAASGNSSEGGPARLRVIW